MFLRAVPSGGSNKARNRTRLDLSPFVSSLSRFINVRPRQMVSKNKFTSCLISQLKPIYLINKANSVEAKQEERNVIENLQAESHMMTPLPANMSKTCVCVCVAAGGDKDLEAEEPSSSGLRRVHLHRVNPSRVRHRRQERPLQSEQQDR